MNPAPHTRPWWCRRTSWLLLYLAALAASHLWQSLRPNPATTPQPQPATPVVLLAASPPPAEWGLFHLPFPIDNTLSEDARRRHWSEAGQAAALADLLTPGPDGGRVIAARGLATPAALQLAVTRPELVRALVLDQPDGLPELHLLGDPALNRAVHALTALGVRSAGALLPHFGAVTRHHLNQPRVLLQTRFDHTARNLALIQCPVLIVSRRPVREAFTDPAVEFHRRLPQSRLVHLPPGAPLDLHVRLAADSAHTALLPVRAHAAPDRVRRAAEPWSPRPLFTGVRLLIVVLLLAAAMQTSEDLTCIAAGILVARGVIDFLPATAGCFLGIILGDLGLYLIGRGLGRPALRRRPLRWMITEPALLRGERAFRKRGAALIFSSRFLPGMRVPMYITAGILRLPIGPFLGWLTLAALLWTPALVGLAALTGSRLTSFLESGAGRGWIIAAVVLGLWMAVHHLLPLATWRGRRLARSRWVRLRKWEYWSRWSFYPPVVARIAWLVIRHRGLRQLSVVNPGMPSGGGFLRERKSEIFTGLRAAPELPPWTLLPGERPPTDRLAGLEAFLDRQRLSYPVVLKPDIGLRGHGVAIIPDAARAARYLAETPVDVIAQPYLPGLEYGIFYLRHPAQPKGRVFSLARKLYPALTGDGRRTLEQLLLSDERGIGMAEFFLAKFADRLDDVPAGGERIPLTEIGSHCRGAIFASGMDLLTPELEAAIDRIARGYAGFNFGRFDIKAPSDDHVRRGEGLRIVELNGLTSEPAHMYDPAHSVFYAWRTMFGLWSEAFQIADENLAAGHRPLTWREILAIYREYLETEQHEAPR
jgi:membrane protein DedA with SNARE-associated domain